MKTRTYKALLIAVLMMQIGTAALIFVTAQNNTAVELQAMQRFSNDLLKMHTLLGEYELQIAANNNVENMQEYEKLQLAVYDDLDTLEKSSTSADRKAIYQEQRKLFDSATRVMQAVREGVNMRAGADRFALMVVMLAGMRKLHKISTKLHENQVALAESAHIGGAGANQALPMVAVAFSVLSAGLAVVLLAKGPTSY
jgi:flagellar biosynthesis GTPase FlhF